MIPPYPLHWPDTLPRTERRESSRMRTSLAAALENVRDSLRRFGDDTGKPVADASLSSNVGGLSLSEQKLKDPGVAVWFQWDGAPRCIAVDRGSPAISMLRPGSRDKTRPNCINALQHGRDEITTPERIAP